MGSISPLSPTFNLLDDSPEGSPLEYFNPTSTLSSIHDHELDFHPEDEPSDEWKTQRKQMIEEDMQPIIHEAKNRLEDVLQGLQGQEGLEGMRAQYMETFRVCSQALRALAKEELECAVKRERLLLAIRRNLPVPMLAMHDELDDDEGFGEGDGELIDHLDIEREQAAALSQTPALEEKFQSLIDLEPEEEEEEEEEDFKKPMQDASAMTVVTLTRLEPVPDTRPDGEKVWKSASSAAKEYQERIKQQRAALKAAAAPQIPPPEPPKRWVSASDAAQRYRRITG
ncbi:hypothetical protein MKEN_00052500 [Mycena kentingensis (nom. inval.)]|nr:hypothetical protein MKEN_00052500 [Mycena kentingensis (nom. inval.)]